MLAKKIFFGKFVKLILSLIVLNFICIDWAFASYVSSKTRVRQVEQKFKVDSAAANRLKAWRRMLRDKKPRKMFRLLQEVNDFFNNRLVYVSDSQLNQRADDWMTPYEFLADGGGDCEDFAIAKYFTLVIMGVPESRLRITYVSIPARNLAHMVLAYYPTSGSEPYILDNLTNSILPASKRPDLVPVYSFNRGKAWLNDRIGRSKEYGKPEDLSKWRDLLYRYNLEEEM